MQNTLLGIGIALILALVAALVGPSFVNWNNHRAFFEAEASRLIGLPVRVSGAIDVEILPTPSMTLRAIEITHADDESRLRAGALAITLGLGSLMRGELKAVDTRLIGPELSLKLHQNGTIELPRMAIGTKADVLSIDKLTVEEGRAILVDASSGDRRVLDKLTFKGQVRSLAGPYRGDGSFVIADARYSYQISTARVTDEGLKIKLTVETERPLTIVADGTLAFDQGVPQFDGNLELKRPVGVALASGKAMVSEPWGATSKVKLTSTNALFEQVEFSYGPEERAVKLNGAAELKFGDQPRLQGVLSARHVDLDRLIAKPEMIRPLPLVAVKMFSEMFTGVLQPTLPVRLNVNADAVTLGGAMLQAVNGDLSTRGNAWQLERLEFRAPGFAQVIAKGRVDTSGRGQTFVGDIDIKASDSMTLVGWLAGTGNPSPGVIKTLLVRGDVSLSPDRIAVDNLKGKYDQATLDGRFDYSWSAANQPSRLNANLNATEIDIDAWTQVAGSIFSGLALEWPREADVTLNVDKARFAGLDARKAAVQMKLDSDGLDLKRFSINGFGGATVDAAGRIEALTSAPRGNIRLDVDAREPAGVIALVEKFAPLVADQVRKLTAKQPTTKLKANLSVESSGLDVVGKLAIAKLGIEGQIGLYRFKVDGSTSADLALFARENYAAIASSELKLFGQVDVDDGSTLLQALDLERMAGGEKKPGRLNIGLTGPINRTMAIETRLAAGLIDLTGRGNANIAFDQPLTAQFNAVSGTIGGSKIKGQLDVKFGSPVELGGAIEAERIDVPTSVAGLLGASFAQLKTSDASGAEKWSLEPFARNNSTLAGRLDLKIGRAVLSERVAVQSVMAVLQFGASKSRIEVKDGDLGSGRLVGQISFFSSNEGLSALSYFELIGAEAAMLFPAEGRPVSGNVTMQATIEGAGLSPAAFFGSLHGNGTLTVEDAALRGLYPKVFEALTRAVDLGIPADNRQIREFVSIMLNSGSLSVKKVDSNIAVVGGQARLTDTRLEASGADLGVTARLNLADVSLDAVLSLSGAPVAGVSGRPAVMVTLKGPLATPAYGLNTDTLAGWLALRSVEQQSKRIETIEAARRAMTGQAPSLLPATSPLTTNSISDRVPDDNDAGSQPPPTPSEPASAPTITPDTNAGGGIFGVIKVLPLAPPGTTEP